MKIAVIGLRNHAARMARLAARQEGVAEVAMYHPDPARIAATEALKLSCPVRLTSDFDVVSACDGVIVAAPHPAHLDYILRLADSHARILCEKPPAATPGELDRLAALPDGFKRRIDFNFNYANTDFAAVAREALHSGRLGQPVALAFTATHGLAFKPSYATDWRMTATDPFSGILGNVGIHYIHLAMELLGPLAGGRAVTLRRAPAARQSDSASLFLETRCGVPVTVLLSYAAPYENSARLVLTDGIVGLDDGAVGVCSPREVFDEDGRFCKPPTEIVASSRSSKLYYDASIERTLAAFLSRIGDPPEFEPARYDRALDAARWVLELADRNPLGEAEPPSPVVSKRLSGIRT